MIRSRRRSASCRNTARSELGSITNVTLRVQQLYILLYLQSYVVTVNEQVRRSDDQ